MQFLKKYLFPLFFYILVIGIFFKDVFLGENSIIIHDNLTFFYPAFLKGLSFWDSYLQLGFPIGHDPQFQTFYIIKYLFPKNELGFTLYVLSSILIGAYFTYLLVLKLTDHLFASIFAGLVFGFSGNFLGQLSMAGVPITSAYLPLVVLSHFLLFENPTSRKFHLLNLLAIYLNISAGYPQASIFNFLLAYLLLLGIYLFEKKYRKNYLIIIGSGLIGILLCSVILLPAFELMQYSARGKLPDNSTFNAYSFIELDYIKILYPYFFGGLAENENFAFVYKQASTPIHNFHEQQRYMGIIVFPLLAFAYKSIQDKKTRFALFGLGLFYFLFTMGTNSIVGQLFFKLPVFNKFRGPNRHFVELSFVVAILSGFAIRRAVGFWENISKKEIIAFVILTLTCVCLPIAIIYSNPDLKIHYAENLWKNNLIGLQIVFLFISMALIFLQRYFKKWGAMAFVGLLFLDLLFVGSHQDWKVFRLKPHEISNLETPILNQKESDFAFLTDELFPPSVIFQQNEEIDFPKVNHLYNNLNSTVHLKSLLVYSPLVFSRNFHIGEASKENSYLARLFGVRYMTQLTEFSNRELDKYSIIGKCPDMNFHSLFGGNNFKSELLPIGTNKFTFFYSLLCNPINTLSESKMIAVFQNAKKEQFQTEISLVGKSMGISDCKKIIGFYKKIRLEGKNNCSYIYEASIDLPEGFNPTHFHIAPENMAVGLYAYQFRRNSITKYSNFLDKDIPRDSKLLYSENGFAVYELTNPKPEMYFAKEVEVKKDFEIWAIFSDKNYSKESQEITYVETNDQSIQERLKNISYNPNNKILAITKDGYETVVNVELESDAFLIFNQTFFGGWKVFIDGTESKILQTNYIVSGVWIPKGSQKIEFRYRPRMLFIGMGISLFAFLVAIVFLWRYYQN